MFGDRVAHIVLGCTDATADEKQGQIDNAARLELWRARKTKYLAHLHDEADEDTLLVCGSDKLYNARLIASDVMVHGENVFAGYRITTDSIDSRLSSAIAQMSQPVMGN